MAENENSSDAGKSAEGGQNGADLPPVNQPVWVQCEGYRTMAYRDKEGKWRNFYNDKEITGKVIVIGPE